MIDLAWRIKLAFSDELIGLLLGFRTSRVGKIIYSDLFPYTLRLRKNRSRLAFHTQFSSKSDSVRKVVP
ncbi:MAG: hypothetical protein DMF75_21535 [Acidobacteria bacterium]|nr:MAG: hypothetical protein DMF75_21535 [Acidobacteriota bacterium]